MRWADVPGYEGYYEVSDTGVVRGVDRTLCDGTFWKGRELKPWTSQGGYLYVLLAKDAKKKNERVHRLVLRAFIGEPESGRDVAMHLNNDTKDNRLENLKWGTHKENQEQSVREKRHRQSRKTQCSRGHLLEPWNLRPLPNSRECLACCQARNFFRSKLRSEEGRTEEKLQERADYYYKILKETAA